MNYLTYDEFKQLTGNDEVTEDAFNKLLPKASDLLNIKTRSFYEFNDLESDIEFRKTRFKKALSAQISYFDELGATTHESINKAPQSFSAGRTSVSNGNRSADVDSQQKSLLAEEVTLYLSGTGLLNRGASR